MRSLAWIVAAGLISLVEIDRTAAAEPTAPMRAWQLGEPQGQFRPLGELTVVRGQLDEPLVTDRPDFTEASTTVGKGVVQLEAGYTFGYDDNKQDGTLIRDHGAPEALWRIGITDEFELRIVWNYNWEHTSDAGTATNIDGADDLSLGAKIELWEATDLLPETAVIVAFTLPTGAEAFSSNNLTYGVNFLYSWELPYDLSLGASTGFTTAREVLIFGQPGPGIDVITLADRHVVFSQSLALGVPLTDAFGMYLEYFGLYSAGRQADFPENYVDGGFTYLLNNDVQLDVRAGLGLNEQAQDFFTGAGISVRF